MRLTNHDKLVIFLTNTQGAEFHRRASKYTVLRQRNGSNEFWYIGKAGALRKGNTIQSSESYTDSHGRAFIKKGEELGLYVNKEVLRQFKELCEANNI